MGLTAEQLKSIWLAQQRVNNLRYKFMNTADKAAFDAEQETVYSEMASFLMQRWGSTVGNYGATEDFTDLGQDPVYPPSGTSTIGNVVTQTQLEKHVTQVNKNYFNLNLMDIADPVLNTNTTNTLEEVWVFAYDPHSPDIPDPLINSDGTAKNPLNTIPNNIIYKRFLSDMNTWNPGTPDMFSLNNYFLVNNSDKSITWVNKYDPTQQFDWMRITEQNGDILSGTLTTNNKTELDMGLNQGLYDPSHPENIDSGWSLLSSGSGIWIWQFSYSDSSYRLQIIRQPDNSYKHAVLYAKLSQEDWYNLYVGPNY